MFIGLLSLGLSLFFHSVLGGGSHHFFPENGIMIYDPKKYSIPNPSLQKEDAFWREQNKEKRMKEAYMQALNKAVTDLRESFELYHTFMTKENCARMCFFEEQLMEVRKQCNEKGYLIEPLDSIVKKILIHHEKKYDN
jgi:hypothetical protein